MDFFKRKKNVSTIPDQLKNRVFKGYSFNNWFYLDSTKIKEAKGYPFANACFEIGDNIIIAHGTKGNESPRGFIDNNQKNSFIIDESVKPFNLNGKQVYYVKRIEEDSEYRYKNELLDFVFKSSDHLRYENGHHVSGPHGGANRAIKVEPLDDDSYSVTLYNLDGNHPVWQNNIQMSPKRMKIIKQSGEIVKLKGFGYDNMGSPFADYGLTIKFKNSSVENCTLHMYDRNVDIEYIKPSDQNTNENNSLENDFSEFLSFIQKWFNETPMNKRIQIAGNSDELNNQGCYYKKMGDMVNAISFFNQALELLPINDDAMKNLISCYQTQGQFQKLALIQIKLEHLKKIKYSN